MRVLFSLSANPTLAIPAGPFGGDELVVERRASDWGLSNLERSLLIAKESAMLAAKMRDFDAVVLCTVSMHAFVLARLKRSTAPRTRLFCADFLVPADRPAVRLVSSFLRDVDGFMCIRSGDVDTLARRFQVRQERAHFVHFPFDDRARLLDTSRSPDHYIYSAGWAHRDWQTMIAAVAKTEHRAILSAGTPLEIPPHARDRISVLDMQTPEAGRRLLAAATMIALSFVDTELPMGPVVLLDAMVAGKAVVATDVNGTRDYVRPGETGLLIPPQDVDAFATAVERVMSDELLRGRLARAAREDVTRRFTMDNFLTKTLAAIR